MSDPITYQAMADYVSAQLKPLHEHVAAHDAWHLGILTGQAQERAKSARATLQTIFAGASVLVAAIAVIVTVAALHR